MSEVEVDKTALTDALFALQSNPKMAMQDNDIIKSLVKSSVYQIAKNLRQEQGGIVIDKLGDDPIPGVTLQYDKVKIAKNYKDINECGYIDSDIKTGNNIPVSQMLHRREDSRILVPYANLNQTNESIEDHIKKLKESIVRVFSHTDHPVNESQILVNRDNDNNAVLQITTKHVTNIEENKKITDAIKTDIETYYHDDVLKLAIDHGYVRFEYDKHFQKYPLFNEVPPAGGVFPYLMKSLTGTPIYVSIENLNISVNHQNFNISNSHNININAPVNQNVQISVSFNDAIQQFVTHIKAQSPTWYVEGSWMHLCDLKQKFDEFNGAQFKCERKFNKLVKTRLGKYSLRKNIGGRERLAVLLKKRVDLQ